MSGSVWLTIPSARPAEQVESVLAKWKERGYKIALYLDSSPTGPIVKMCDTFLYPLDGKYSGYARAVNSLVNLILGHGPDGNPRNPVDANAEWFIAAGDDTLPDPNHTAEEIAASCSRYFPRRNERKYEFNPHTFGVMQPTGDPWRDVQGRIIERIAGSAWLGREFCKRINRGNGPLWPEYTHCFVDEELQCVAQKYGVFWQRPDLIHHHEHWARKNGDVRDMPAHLIEANSAAHWEKYKGIFTARKAAGFPGSEPL